MAHDLRTLIEQLPCEGHAVCSSLVNCSSVILPIVSSNLVRGFWASLSASSNTAIAADAARNTPAGLEDNLALFRRIEKETKTLQNK